MKMSIKDVGNSQFLNTKVVSGIRFFCIRSEPSVLKSTSAPSFVNGHRGTAT